MCDLISKGTPGSDKRGKHDSRPNHIPETAKQSVHEFNKIPKDVVITQRQNPHLHYLSPDLNEKKLYDLYVTFVSERAIQGDFCNRVTSLWSFKIRHLQNL